MAQRGDGDPQAGRPQNQEYESAKAEADQRRQKPDPAHRRIGDDGNGCDTENDGEHEAPRLIHKIALFVFEGPELAWIGDGIADVFQGLQQTFGTRDSGIVFDERLFVRETHRHLVDARHAAERFLDGAGAKRAMKAADARADLAAVGTARRFLAPRLEG